jgi:hypothetical protein
VMIGPDSLGHFRTTVIKSIERKRIHVHACSAGQSGSFALKGVRRNEVRKGMVVLPKLDQAPKVYREFVAEGKLISSSNPRVLQLEPCGLGKLPWFAPQSLCPYCCDFGEFILTFSC